MFSLPSETLEHIVLYTGPIGCAMLFMTCSAMRPVVREHIGLKKHLCGHIAASGKVRLMKWAIDNGCQMSSYSATAAAEHGKLDMLKYIKAVKYPQCRLPPSAIVAAAGANQFRITRWLIITNKMSTPPGALCAAAFANHFDMVKWLLYTYTYHQRKCIGLDDGFLDAAKAGNLRIIKWLKTRHEDEFGNQCLNQYDMQWICGTAARYCHNNIIRWCIANGLDYIHCDTIQSAISGGNIRGVILLSDIRHNAFPLDYDACKSASYNGHLPMIKWLRLHGHPVNVEVIRRKAIKYGHTHIVDWLDSLPPV